MSKFQQPIIRRELTTLSAIELEEDRYFSETEFNNCSIIGEEIKRIKFEQVIFNKCDLLNTDFSL
ncbi:hypothetical protein [Bacillus sp. AFS041924]|uniref:hypothetical protein n=1 Tax=Bacillus sp. AFS041924 TaxID=2033503 RepID=UPI000BFE78C8|nr:hypothetical protein [Bacillus sp. AFS041924]PGS49518.1 hypothetical protein COC46_15145 [Bacillus sp. AFS041924]